MTYHLHVWWLAQRTDRQKEATKLGLRSPIPFHQVFFWSAASPPELFPASEIFSSFLFSICSCNSTTTLFANTTNLQVALCLNISLENHRFLCSLPHSCTFHTLFTRDCLFVVWGACWQWSLKALVYLSDWHKFTYLAATVNHLGFAFARSLFLSLQIYLILFVSINLFARVTPHIM